MKRKELSFEELVDSGLNNPVMPICFLIAFVLYVPVALIVHTIQYVCHFICLSSPKKK